jgi:hypothetical protein
MTLIIVQRVNIVMALNYKCLGGFFFNAVPIAALLGKEQGA